jgi:hypothetical protein
MPKKVNAGLQKIRENQGYLDNATWKSLRTDGYAVREIPGWAAAINVDEVNEVVTAMTAATPIFQQLGAAPSETNIGDGLRVQFTLKDSDRDDDEPAFGPMRIISEVVKKWLRQELAWKSFVSIETNLILSYPNCQEQAPHVDGEVTTRSAYRPAFQKLFCFPLSVIVALMPGTRIVAWPKSHVTYDRILTKEMGKTLSSAEEPSVITAIDVDISVGHAIIFRQDFVHAGASYLNSNLRMHLYIDHPGFKRTPDTTRLISETEREFFAR